MAQFQPAKYNSKPFDIADAIRLTADNLELAWDGTVEKYYGQVAAWLTRESDGSQIPALVFRRGDEFVALPNVYSDEGTEFESTAGKYYSLLDNGSYVVRPSQF